MAALSDAQLVMLSCASQRDDGAVDPARTRKGGATAKVVASLLSRHLLAEIESGPDMPVWRRGGSEERLSLVITSAGKQLIGVDDEPLTEERYVTNTADDGAKESFEAAAVQEAASTPLLVGAAPSSAQTLSLDHTAAAPAASLSNRDAMAPQAADATLARPPSAHSGTKRELVIAMLSKEHGVSIGEIIDATSWLPHSSRATLSVLRKQGFVIERFFDADRKTRYRILAAHAPADRLVVAVGPARETAGTV